MKAILLKLLALFGLAPATHVAHANAQARRAVDKAARLEERLAALRDERDSWKQRHQEATSALEKSQKAARRAEEKVARARDHTRRARAQVDEWRTRAEAL